MSTEKLRLAIVGCGFIAKAHINGIKDLISHGCQDFEVTSCCDLDREKAEACAEEIGKFQKRKPKVIIGSDKLVKSGVADAVILCLPHCFHHTVTEQLMAAGMDVLLEKPVGITVKASKKIIESAKKHKRVLATAEQARRSLSARACRWAICEAGMIGEPRFADIQFIVNRPLNVDSPMFKWRGIKLLTGGGMIMDSGAHFSDMMLQLFGEVDTVSCDMHTHVDLFIKDAPVLGDCKVDVEDTFHVVINFKNGMRVNWNFCNVQPGGDRTHGYYYGSEGKMEDTGFVLHCFQAGGKLIQADGTEKSPEWIEREYLMSLDDETKQRLFPYGVTEGVSVEIADFIRAVKNQEKPEIDGEGGMLAKTLSMAMYESSELNGQTIKFEDVLSGKIHAYQDPIDEYWKL